MYHFEYVTKRERKEEKEKLIELINHVQNEVRDHFTFRYDFVGSDQRNMVTCDRRSNIGYDFDVNIQPNDDDENYSAAELKQILMDALNKYCRRFGYDFCENSTRVMTIKSIDYIHSRIIHSCDFAIIYNCKDGRQQYIRFNKQYNTYTWEYQGKGFYELPKKVQFCKDNNLWNDVKELYLEKKNSNDDRGKKSRHIFAETIHQVCQQNGYYD